MSFFHRRRRKRPRHSERSTRDIQHRHRAAPIAGVALLLLLVSLGGASRNNLLVQPIVQVGAIIITAVMLMRPRPDDDTTIGNLTPLIWTMAALAAFMAAQLVPLPPGLWRALPARDLEAAITDATGLAGTWRPLSIVPDNTLSSLLGMIVPAAVLIVYTRTPARFRGRLMWLIAWVGVVELLLALAQLATGRGIFFFYPRTAGTVTGFFHNRNHLAIFLGTLPPVFAYIVLSQRDGLDRREPLWAGFTLAIALTIFGILLTGSRIGVAVVALTTIGAGLMVWRTAPRLRARVSRPTSRRTQIAVISGSIAACAALLGLVLARGDTALTRLSATHLGEEGRVGVLGSLIDLAGRYLPFGSGFGTFDRAFRIIEPDSKLRLSYLNHAHNDFVEIVIEGGIVSIIIAAVLATFALRRTWTAWQVRSHFDQERELARVGSIVAIGLLAGSISDYPLRTPMLAGWAALALCLLFTMARPATR